MGIESLSLAWLSDIRAAGTMSHKLYGFRIVLEVFCLSKFMLIVPGNALRFFTGPGNVIPFSVDLSDFCRSFKIESETTIKIYISHDNRLINEFHNVIKGNRLLGTLTKSWYRSNFWAQKRMFCKLCRIKRRFLGFILVVQSFLQKGKIDQFRKSWALNSDPEQVLMRNLTSGRVRW